jgi:hypothetical protein
MAQLFPPSSNSFARASVVGIPLLVFGALAVFGLLYRSSYVNRVLVARRQPLPFSHKHHVGQLGIDCRYCHAGVEVSAFAGLPASETCMSCHAQIWADSPVLAPLRESYRENRSLRWTRVNQLPDYVYFNHAIHLHKGVGCSTCHGRVDRMPLTFRQEALTMKWCLSCHKDPAPYLRPRAQVFEMGWQAPADQRARGQALMQRYRIDKQRLADCSVCHR